MANHINDLTAFIEEMVYVATDQTQPGTAYAICVDKPEWKKYTAMDIGNWVMDGAIVLHVPMSVGMDMIKKWVRPPQ